MIQPKHGDFSAWNWLGGKVMFNFLARDEENLVEVMDACEGHALIGVLTRDYPDAKSGAEAVLRFSRAGASVSLGLGGGDPAQWEAVIQVALLARPAHINQVFPLSSYTAAVLKGRYGEDIPLINSLVSPTGKPGFVNIATGPLSSKRGPAEIPCEAAVAILKEQGLLSVKFFPLNERYEEMKALVSACSAEGIPVFEPTGGITVENLRRVLETAFSAGATYVIPHVYSSIIDKSSGKTMPGKVRELYVAAKEVLGV
ncbi:MAG: oxo-acid lyase [Candidatus Fermentithermobacillus carboniphilus]|uniref:Oxo-acid lyase n=1 Tax=Candidatus Fermentithermobacillus carboniphilus TaxID=3085328 RepID=A0AAT9LG96_9FIRM|nr:MAG: oxo-acid lyase [Candidatus Fermentithermobacillus carboniphilus]